MRTRSTSRFVAALGLSGLLVLMLGAPAMARQESRDRYTWSDGGSYQCSDGAWVDWTAGGSGTLAMREGTGPQAGMVFAHDNYQWGATDVRRSDGASVHWSWLGQHAGDPGSAHRRLHLRDDIGGRRSARRDRRRW